MHIVQLIPQLNQGGVERGVIELNRELIKLSHKSTIISFGGNEVKKITNDGGTHYTLDVWSKNPFNFFLRAKKLKQLIQIIKPDILHARSRVPAWMTWYINKKLKIPFITTVHGFNSVNSYSAIMTKGDMVIYSSRSIKNHIIQNYKINPEKLRYVPRGIDTDFFNVKKVDHLWISNFINKYNLHNKKIFTMVGRITEWKGHHLFIQAIAEIQKNEPNLIGLIVGGVWKGKEKYYKELKNLVEKYNANIIFTGSKNEVREIYSISDLVISPSTSKPETFGRVAAEALSMNTPVIASAHGGSLDIIKHGENGYLFAPGNLDELIDKIKIINKIKIENLSSHIVNNFSLSVTTKKLLSIYKECIK